MNGVLQVWVRQSSTCIESQKKRFSSTNPRRKLTPIAKCLKSFKCLIQKRFDITSQVTWPRPPMTSYTSLFLLGLPTLACSLGRHSSHSWLEKFLISLGFTVIYLKLIFSPQLLKLNVSEAKKMIHHTDGPLALKYLNKIKPIGIARQFPVCL